jgi:hypothetical protein
MVKALRRRPATQHERMRGQGPLVGDVIDYHLDRREVMAAMRKSIVEDDATPITWDDYRTVDAGRPVREEALKYAIGDLALRKSLVDPADAEPERGRDYEAVELVYVAPGAPLAKAERATLWMEGGRRELQRRLLAAIARGDERVSANDVAGLDDGGRIRKAALEAVMDPDEYLGDFGDADLGGGQPLAKSARLSKREVVGSWKGLGDAMTAAGIDPVKALKKSLERHGHQVSDEEARDLARQISGGRRVECNTSKTACAVR